jgi:hypothetical protein
MAKHRTITHGFAALAGVITAAMSLASPALAWDGHHGSRGYFSFSFGYPSYYYAPYPYYAPTYAYSPYYAYPPSYGYAYPPSYGYDPSMYQPAPAQADDQQSYCREFQSTIVVEGRQQQAFGTACLQPDGSWQIVNGPR